MRVKSYYAASVEEAMSRACVELGSEAVLIHSRKSTAGTRHLGPYEVVFAAGKEVSQGDAPADQPPKQRSIRPIDEHTEESTLSLEVMQIRRQMEDIRRCLALRQPPGGDVPHSLSDCLCRLLLGTAMDENLARVVAEAATASLKEEPAMADPDALRCLVRPELERRLTPPSREEWEKAQAFAMIGPPGAGKTSSLIKLAVRLQDSSGASVHLVSADPFRIGASEQLRSYASILGAGFDVANDMAALRRLVETHHGRRTILIDTPGLSGIDFDLLQDLARTLASSHDVQRVLVLPATMRAGDLKRSLKQYDAFQPDGLLFSRLDETDLFGALYSAAAWSRLPVNYLSAGQQVPEDLEAASIDRIVELVLAGDTTSPTLN